MPQIFQPRANQVVLFIVYGIIALLVLGPGIWMVQARSPYATGALQALDQPVPFSHEHHVGKIGLDCRYCHQGVETSASAGLPATEVCMTCHSQLFTDAKMLAPVRQSLATGIPIQWQRVHNLPDYVYFNHAVHINNGVGCESCHGRVDQMPLTWQQQPLTMQWCLGCHRDPGPNLRPQSDIFTMGWKPQGDRRKTGDALIAAYHINTKTMTDCYVCHR